MRRFSWLAVVAILVLSAPGLLWAQASGRETPPPAPLSFKVLVDQLAAMFPALRTDIVEVAGTRVTLASGRAEGAQVGLELVAFREGRELIHPVTRKSLGRTEETLGRLVVAEVFDNYSVATLLEGAGLRPGDRARVPGGKVRLTVMGLSSGPRPRVVEAATYDLIQEIERTGRFQVMLGDQAAVWLAEQQIAPDQALGGKGIKPVLERFRIANLLALHFTTVQGKPFIDARVFTSSSDAALVQTAFFVPPSAKPKPSQEFSSGPGGEPVKIERRSLLARLLSGDWEPNTYSAGRASIPIRALATFPFMVVSLDVAVAPQDGMPRIAVTDGQRVFLYRLREQKLEAEWTHDKLMVGGILSVQLADVDGDGTLDVVVNRQDYKARMLSYILTTRNGRPAVLAEDISVILLAVDDKGDGLKRTLWGQAYHTDAFFTRGTATRYTLQGKDVAAAERQSVPDSFLILGATLSSVNGKDSRVLAFVDEKGKLRLASQGQELWQSLSAVGGGLARAHLQFQAFQTTIDKFIRIEPNPISVDLDGDGVEEIVVAVNEEEAGKMAVVFKGPPGFRMQVVSSGFEGMVTGLGAIPGDPLPSLVVAVVKRTGLLRGSGETQLIMTVPE